jgi:hypothetical protein
MKRYGITDVIWFIFEVEKGLRPLTPLQDPMEVFAGNVEYVSNSHRESWKMVVFNDCNEWDYIDSITDPSGFKWTTDAVEFFFQYDPPQDVIERVYGIKDFPRNPGASVVSDEGLL